MDRFPGFCKKKVEKSGQESWHLIATIIKNSSSYFFFYYFEIFIDFFQWSDTWYLRAWAQTNFLIC